MHSATKIALLVCLAFGLLVVTGATRTVNAATAPAPGFGHQSSTVDIPENGAFIDLGQSVTSGDVVFLECSVDPTDPVFTATCDPKNLNLWSDVLRFCDDPLADPCPQGSTTHVQLMSDCTDPDFSKGLCSPSITFLPPPFTDEFTGHFLDLSKLSANAVICGDPFHGFFGGPHNFCTGETLTGATLYLNTYNVLSDAPERAPVPEFSGPIAILISLAAIPLVLGSRKRLPVKI